MKKMILPVFAFFIVGALFFSAMAQEEAVKEPTDGLVQADAVKKPAVFPFLVSGSDTPPWERKKGKQK